MRATVGDDYVVGCRNLSDECIGDGSDVEDAKFFGIEFARDGMDFLSISRGGKFEDAARPKAGWDEPGVKLSRDGRRRQATAGDGSSPLPGRHKQILNWISIRIEQGRA